MVINHLPNGMIFQVSHEFLTKKHHSQQLSDYDGASKNQYIFWLNPRRLHPRKLTCPLKRDYLNRKYIFQPLVFKGYVSFPGGNIEPENDGLVQVIFLHGCILHVKKSGV